MLKNIVISFILISSLMLSGCGCYLHCNVQTKDNNISDKE